MLEFSIINTPSLWVDCQRRMVGHMAITMSGPLDMLSFRHNEWLLGAYAQVQLESRGGLQFTVSEPVSLCITGATVDIKVAQTVYSSYEIIPILPKQTVTVGMPSQGKVIYLGFSTKLTLYKALGSVCAVGREDFGGAYHDGQMLRAPFACAMQNSVQLRHYKASFKPFWQQSSPSSLAVIPAFQYAQFDIVSRMRFVSLSYHISSKADRMGIRLNCAKALESPSISESQPIALGAIQIPPDGMPIVLLADKQTTGGYPIIGCLSRKSITQLVQLSGEFAFSWITPENAQATWQTQLAGDSQKIRT